MRGGCRLTAAVVCWTVFPNARGFRRLRRPDSSRRRAAPWAAPVPPTERAGSEEVIYAACGGYKIAAGPPPSPFEPSELLPLQSFFTTCREAALKLAPVRAPYLASAAILYNSRGRSPQNPPGRRSRFRAEPLAPRGAAPSAPSTLAAKPRQPSGIQPSITIASLSFQYFKLCFASFFCRRHLESGINPFFQFRHVGDNAHQTAGVLQVD